VEKHHFDITIIGAGVVGLAIAEELSRHYKEILLLEKNESQGQETSSRNSEVIHAGIYYPEGSRVDEGKRDAFYESILTYLPLLAKESLNPDMSGIRPKLQGPGEDIRDFVIREESRLGLPDWVNLIGIESPGLTACLAIAKQVARLIEPLME
jgi:L-2-hydroxyglutarate oxidase LhgO